MIQRRRGVPAFAELLVAVKTHVHEGRRNVLEKGEAGRGVGDHESHAVPPQMPHELLGHEGRTAHLDDVS